MTIANVELNGTFCFDKEIKFVYNIKCDMFCNQDNVNLLNKAKY